MPTAKNALQVLLTLAGDFVLKQKGCWGHEEWEALLSKAEQTGFMFDDEGKRNLGNILEALKFFYFKMPEPPTPAKSRKKATSKEE